MNSFEEKKFLKDETIISLNEKGETIFLILEGKC